MRILPDEYLFYGMHVPSHTMEDLHAYIEQRCPVGEFLYAVLSNNLKESIARADPKNMQNIPAIVGFIYNYAPEQCWGSEEKVKEWLNPPKEVDDDTTT